MKTAKIEKTNLPLRALHCRAFIILSLLFLPASIFAKAVTVDDNTVIEYQPYLEYFVENSGELSLEEIRKKEFLPLPGGKANFGFKDAAYWFKLKIKFSRDEQKDYFLVLDYPLLDEADFQVISTKGAATLFSGDMRPFSNRSIDHRLINMLIQAEPGQLVEVYYRLRTSGSMQAAGRIIPEDEYRSIIAEEQMILGFYYGAMVILVIFNLFIYFYLKEKVYLIYSTYNSFYLLFQMCINGTAFSILFKSYPMIANYLLPVSFFQAIFWAFWFVLAFLQAEKRKTFSKVLRFAMILIFIFSVLSLIIPYKYMILFVALVGSTAPIMYLITGILRFKDGYKPASYYLIAWGFFILGCVLFGLKTSNLIPVNIFTENAIQVGSLLEAVLLSLGLAYRFDLIRVENQKYSEELKEYSEKLEEKVEARTLELQQTFSALQSTQKDLVESEKKAALTQLAAGMAHELNNSLNYIAAAVPSLRNNFSDVEKVLLEILDGESSPEALGIKDFLVQRFEQSGKSFEDIETAMRRTADIVKEVRGMTELDGKILTTINLRKTIREELMQSRVILLQDEEKGKIRVYLSIDGNPELVMNHYAVSQILRRLFLNGLSYAYGNRYPELKVKVDRGDQSKHYNISIANNGIAIPKDAEDKIFNPFFTTKKIGTGRGTGLTLARSLAENYNGSLRLADHGRDSGWVAFMLQLPETIENTI